MSHPDEIALTEGDWVVSRGVKRWIPWPPRIYPTLIDYDPVAEVPVVCPTCRAKADEICHTRNGYRTSNHKARTVPRLCACGAVLGWKRLYCETCADEATRETRRLSRERCAA